MEPEKMAESGALNHSSGTFDHDLGAFNHSSGTFDHDLGVAAARGKDQGAVDNNPAMHRVFDHDLGVAAARGKDQGAVVYHNFSMGAGRVEDLLGVLPPANDPGAFNHSSGTFDHDLGVAAARGKDQGAVDNSPAMHRVFDHDLGVAAARCKDLGAVVYHNFSMGAGRVEDLLGVLPPANDPGAFNHSSGTFAHKPDMAAARGKDHGPVDNNPAMHRVFDHDLGVAAARGKDQGTVVYHISSMGAGRVEGLLAVPPPADNPGAFNYSSGTFAHQPDMGAGRGVDLLGVLPPTNDPGAFNYNSFRLFLPAMGIVAASSAITGLAAGTATPAAGFGLFVLLLGGLSLVTLRVLGA